jgi:hypothetical protein
MIDLILKQTNCGNKAYLQKGLEICSVREVSI